MRIVEAAGHKAILVRLDDGSVLACALDVPNCSVRAPSMEEAEREIRRALESRSLSQAKTEERGLPTLVCPYCRYDWAPRVPRPRKCPNCKNSLPGWVWR